MAPLNDKMGKAPFVLVGSFVLCLGLGYFMSPDTWGKLWDFWRLFAAGTVGFIIGKIFHD